MVDFSARITSGLIPVYSAIWFDSGYMCLSVYGGVGLAGCDAPSAVFLRGVQALMRCIMVGMDQQEQFMAPCTKLRKFRSSVHHGRRHPCHYAEADRHGPCDQEIPLLLDTVIDIPVVQVVQLLGLWSRRTENCGFPQLQFLSRRSHARCCARQVLLVPQLRRLPVFTQRWLMSLLSGPADPQLLLWR